MSDVCVLCARRYSPAELAPPAVSLYVLNLSIAVASIAPPTSEGGERRRLGATFAEDAHAPWLVVPLAPQQVLHVQTRGSRHELQPLPIKHRAKERVSVYRSHGGGSRERT